jgi:hypothetical protein
VGSSRVKIIVALVLAVASLAFWVLMLGLIFLGKAVPNHHHP